MKFTKETHEFRDMEGIEILDILDYSDVVSIRNPIIITCLDKDGCLIKSSVTKNGMYNPLMTSGRDLVLKKQVWWQAMIAKPYGSKWKPKRTFYIHQKTFDSEEECCNFFRKGFHVENRVSDNFIKAVRFEE